MKYTYRSITSQGLGVLLWFRKKYQLCYLFDWIFLINFIYLIEFPKPKIIKTILKNINYVQRQTATDFRDTNAAKKSILSQETERCKQNRTMLTLSIRTWLQRFEFQGSFESLKENERLKLWGFECDPENPNCDCSKGKTRLSSFDTYESPLTQPGYWVRGSPLSWALNRPIDLII